MSLLLASIEAQGGAIREVLTGEQRRVTTKAKHGRSFSIHLRRSNASGNCFMQNFPYRAGSGGHFREMFFYSFAQPDLMEINSEYGDI